jgi:hypothetical protein
LGCNKYLFIGVRRTQAGELFFSTILKPVWRTSSKIFGDFKRQIVLHLEKKTGFILYSENGVPEELEKRLLENRIMVTCQTDPIP